MKHLPVQVSQEEVKRRKQQEAGEAVTVSSLPFETQGYFLSSLQPPTSKGPAWDILRFPSLPLWEPLSPSLHLASGNAREGAVASWAGLGTCDPRQQL